VEAGRFVMSRLHTRLNIDHCRVPGMHKHFRILAIHNYMITQGLVNAEDEHTTIPGLWTKLGSLYNLPILDEREDSILHSSSDENGSPAELFSPYDLPDPEYGAMKFDKRLNLDGSKSPALVNSRRESTVADTDEPGSSPAPGRRGGRAKKRGGRISKLQQEAGSSRRTSKAASVTEDETMEDAGEEEGEEERGSDEVEDEEEAAEESSKPRSSARGRGGSRGRAARGRGSARSRGRKK
jgi:MRG-binding protein